MGLINYTLFFFIHYISKHSISKSTSNEIKGKNQGKLEFMLINDSSIRYPGEKNQRSIKGKTGFCTLGQKC